MKPVGRCSTATGSTLHQRGGSNRTRPTNIAQQSGFAELGAKQAASRATLFLRSEPALLDRFVEEMTALAAGAESASLEAVERAEVDSIFEVPQVSLLRPDV